MAVKKPISSLTALVGGQIPLDQDTLIEIAWPDVTQPTGYGSYKCKLSELQASLSATGPIYIAKDATLIVANDSGYQDVPMGKLLGDVKQNLGFNKGF